MYNYINCKHVNVCTLIEIRFGRSDFRTNQPRDGDASGLAEVLGRGCRLRSGLGFLQDTYWYLKCTLQYSTCNSQVEGLTVFLLMGFHSSARI